MTWNSLHSPALESWILDVAGKKQIRQGVKLDPLGPSWRALSTQGRVWLSEIHSGGLEASERRSNQALSDLRAAGLLESGGASLTPFGESVLDRWQTFPKGWEFEVPLGVALLQEGLAFGHAGIREMLEFWWDVRRVFDEEELLADRETALVLPYLNQAVGGFNPWAALRDGGGPVSPRIPWKELRTWVESDLAKKAIAQLQDRLDPSRRLAGRVCFCRAMSLLFESHRGYAAPYLSGLKLPVRGTR